jgi:murein L,D-transpeptidase YcbB/YkuD
VSEQVSELLRQQLEAWKTPPEAAALSAPDALGTPPTSTAEPPASSTANTPSAAPAVAPAEAQPAKTAKVLPKLTVGKEVIRAAVMLSRFYEGREYRPAWSNEDGPLPRADDLIRTIQEEAEREGLRPGDYRLAKLAMLVRKVCQKPGEAQKPLDPCLLADLDLLLTDAFLTYGAHVSVGKLRLNAMDAQWFEQRQKADLVQVLQTAVDTNRVADALKTLPPPHAGYRKLREALALYRKIAAQGGWPQVSNGANLYPEDRDERVVQLRTRLQTTGDLPPKPQPNTSKKRSQGRVPEDRELFDKALDQAVRRFQRRHGLTADGVVGFGTLAALNVSAETRVQQIAVNLQRWRTLPHDLGARHIDVNIPNFSLEVVENDQPVMRMKVVVGKMMERRNTPTFNAGLTHLVLNPYWYVPKSIAEEELFPLSRKDPQYFAKHRFTIQRVPVGEKQISDPNATDGAMSSVKTYQYRLRQEPGPQNSLGRIKFMFPNAYGVYLHDTPSKELFNTRVRTFSHGCIRIEKPIDLAEYLLRETTPWTREAILTAIERQKEQTVWLPEPIPVYIQYWTSWVDRDGTVQFRNDIYGYDRLPGARLPTAPPRPKAESEIQPTGQPEAPPATQPESQPAPPSATQPTL